MTGQLAFGLYAFCFITSTVTGIVDWNPCSSSPYSSEPSSYIVAVDQYLYVHCSSPDDGSYLMQCPGSTVWNQHTNGCMDFDDQSQSPPRLIGPTGGANDRATSTPSPPQTTARHHHSFFSGLAHSLLSSVSGPPTSLFRPPGSSSGGLASRLTVNPCVVDAKGTLSPTRFHSHPDDPSKYLECVPTKRSIVVRRCSLAGATVWSQKLQACISAGGPQVQPPRGQTTPTPGSHHQPPRLVYAHRPRVSSGKNPCRQGGPPFYRPHPKIPSMYYQCSATGRAFMRKCPRGLRWNQTAMTCDRSAPGTRRQRQLRSSRR